MLGVLQNLNVYFGVLLFLFQSFVHLNGTQINFQNEDMSISFNLTFSSSCQSDTYRIQMFPQVMIPNCVTECALRSDCRALNYYNRMKLCELFSNVEIGNKVVGCINIRRENITVIKNPCGVVCTRGQVCDINTKSCVYKECSNVTEVDNGTKLGNMRGIGSRLMDKCDANFTLVPEENMYSYCKDNDQWFPAPGACYKKLCINDSLCFAKIRLTDVYGFDVLKVKATKWQGCALACEGHITEYKTFVFCPDVNWNNNCFCKNVTITDGQPVTSIIYGDLYHKLIT